MNMIILKGRLTSDPKFRANKDGSQTVSFQLACRQNFKRQGAEQADSDFVWFSRYISADKVSSNPYQRLKKGMEIEVTGHLESYQVPENGVNKTRISCIADRFEFCETKAAVEARDAAQAAAAAAQVPVAVPVQG
jgi:single-stranded DNA-binding protein